MEPLSAHQWMLRQIDQSYKSIARAKLEGLVKFNAEAICLKLLLTIIFILPSHFTRCFIEALVAAFGVVAAAVPAAVAAAMLAASFDLAVQALSIPVAL